MKLPFTIELFKKNPDARVFKNEHLFKVLSLDGPDPLFPVVGYVLEDKDVDTFSIDMFEIEVGPEVVWVNKYEDAGGWMKAFNTEEEARLNASKNTLYFIGTFKYGQAE